MNWLLLRGLAREQRHWGGFPELLRSRLPGSKITCLDLPGAGTESARPSPTDLDAIVEDLRSRWSGAAAGGEKPWGVIGISLGGMAALRWCDRYPGDFERAVVINSSAQNLSPPWERIRSQTLVAALPLLLERNPLKREEKILALTTALQGDKLPQVAIEWARIGAETRMRPKAVLSQLIAALGFRAPASVRARLLFVAGMGDRFTSPRCSQRLSERLGAPLVTHPAAGHDLPLDSPDWLSSEIARWAGN